MAETATALEREYMPDEGGKVRLLTFDHLDGRTLAVKRVRELENQIAIDLSGKDNISTAQSSLCRRAAVLSAIIEDTESKWAGDGQIALTEYLQATNCLRRVLATLGLERVARPVKGLPTLLGN